MVRVRGRLGGWAVGRLIKFQVACRTYLHSAVGSGVGSNETVGSNDTVGRAVGAFDISVGAKVKVGSGVGSGDGTAVGSGEGNAEGRADGGAVGIGLGMMVGSKESVGAGLGLPKIVPWDV